MPACDKAGAWLTRAHEPSGKASLNRSGPAPPRDGVPGPGTIVAGLMCGLEAFGETWGKGAPGAVVVEVDSHARATCRPPLQVNARVSRSAPHEAAVWALALWAASMSLRHWLLATTTLSAAAAWFWGAVHSAAPEFPKAAAIADPTGLSNSRLDSGTVRAIDIRAGDAVPAEALKTLVKEAVRLNKSSGDSTGRS